MPNLCVLEVYPHLPSTIVTGPKPLPGLAWLSLTRHQRISQYPCRLSQIFVMKLGRCFPLLISLVLAYCAADIQVCHLFCLNRIINCLVNHFQQIKNNVQNKPIQNGKKEIDHGFEVCVPLIMSNRPLYPIRTLAYARIVM